MRLELAICIKFTRWNKSDALAKIHWRFARRCDGNDIASYSAEILPGHLNTYSNALATTHALSNSQNT